MVLQRNVKFELKSRSKMRTVRNAISMWNSKDQNWDFTQKLFLVFSSATRLHRVHAQCAIFVCSVHRAAYRFIHSPVRGVDIVFLFVHFMPRSFVASLQMSMICNLRTSTSQFRLFSFNALLRIRIVLFICVLRIRFMNRCLPKSKEITIFPFSFGHKIIYFNLIFGLF